MVTAASGRATLPNMEPLPANEGSPPPHAPKKNDSVFYCWSEAML